MNGPIDRVSLDPKTYRPLGTSEFVRRIDEDARTDVAMFCFAHQALLAAAVEKMSDTLDAHQVAFMRSAASGVQSVGTMLMFPELLDPGTDPAEVLEGTAAAQAAMTATALRIRVFRVGDDDTSSHHVDPEVPQCGQVRGEWVCTRPADGHRQHAAGDTNTVRAVW